MHSLSELIFSASSVCSIFCLFSYLLKTTYSAHKTNKIFDEASVPRTNTQETCDLWSLIEILFRSVVIPSVNKLVGETIYNLPVSGKFKLISSLTWLFSIWLADSRSETLSQRNTTMRKKHNRIKNIGNQTNETIVYKFIFVDLNKTTY